MLKKVTIRQLTSSKVFWPFIALLTVLIFNLVTQPGFLNVEVKDGHLFGSIIDIINRASPLIIVAIGMTLVIATGGIDISVGSVVAITGAIAAYCITKGSPLGIVIAAAILLAIVSGAWNGLLVSVLGVQPMVATLILYIVGRGIAQLITNGQILTFNNKSFNFIGGGYLLGLPFAVFIALAVVVFIRVIKTKTSMGLFIESIGSNASASSYTGISAKKYTFIVYIICGICAGIAGLIICSNIKSADANNAGLWMELDAILATVIGGTSMNGGRFYIGGTVVGALFIQSLTTTIYSMGVPPEIILLVKAVVVIVVCLLQSEEFRKVTAAAFNKRKVVG